jgi:cell wall-associated NlpC family hydrolase
MPGTVAWSLHPTQGEDFPLHTSTRRRAGALLVLAMLVSIVCPPPSGADQITDKRDEAARIARQLEQQSRRVSILAEDYDEARVRIATVEADLAAASVKLERTDTQATGVRLRLKQQAVEAYVRGGSSQALALLADTKATDDIAVRAQYVRTLTSGAVDVLDELRAVRQQLDEQRKTLNHAKAEATQVAALAEAKRIEAAQAETEQRATLQQVQGELSDLVAAETKRRAEAESKRVQAELAAKKAREEAAARDAAAREAAAARARSTTTTARQTNGGPVVTPKSPTTSRPSTTTTSPAPKDAPPPSAGAEAAIAEAKRQLGKPYQYGGSGPDSFDCSGLTSWSWRAGGKSLPHSSRAQWSATSRVAISDVLPGDIVFYGSPIHHVGLYVGDGQMIEASETGTPVRYASIYRRDLVGAGRVN